MLRLFIFLAVFSTDIFCEEDFELIPTDGEIIPYTPIDIYKFSKDIRELDLGRPVETFDEVVIQDMLSHSTVCEVLSKVGVDKAYVHTPAVCSSSCIVRGNASSNALCKKTYSDRELCCPADKVPFYSVTFPRVGPQHEPSYKFHEHKLSVDWNEVDTSKPGDFSYSPEFYAANEKEIIKDFQNEKLCGVKKVTDNDYALFFCIPADSCIAPREGADRGPYIAEPLWTEFCNNDWNAWYSPDTWVHQRCCHTNYFPRDHFPRRYSNLVFLKVPNFINYAMGMRSNLMCEAYSRFICGQESGAAECYTTDSKSPRPPEITDPIYINDAPYIARLGVVAPHTVIFHCLGAIVSHQYILSTWDCRQKQGIDTNVVIIGEEDTNNLGQEQNTKHEQVYVISKIVRVWHAEPTLYKTSKDMEFSPKRRPACLYYRQMDRPTYADLPYFGRLKNDDYRGRFLRKQNLFLHRALDDYKYVGFCRTPDYYSLDNLNPNYKRYGAKPEWEFCGGFGIGMSAQNGPCKYDRGTPVVVKMEQPYCSFQILGTLTTERWNCEQDTPLVFSNITRYLSALEDILWPQPFLVQYMPKRNCEFPTGNGTFWGNL